MKKGDKVYCARLDSWNGKRKIEVRSTTVVTVFKNGIAYVVTSDNLDKGAGGGVVLSAEYLKKKRFF